MSIGNANSSIIFLHFQADENLKSSKIYQRNKSLPDLSRTPTVLDYNQLTKENQTSSMEQQQNHFSAQVNIHQISERQLSSQPFGGQFKMQCDPSAKRQSNSQVNHPVNRPVNHQVNRPVNSQVNHPVNHQLTYQQMHQHLGKNNFKNQQNIYNVKTIKTGWLMRKGHNDRWFRHWFVLRDTLLTYYRDQPAEQNSLLDGVFDLALVKRVHLNTAFTVNASSNLTYWPFVITTWNGEKQHELAALSSECRDEWLQLIVDSQSQISSAMAADFSLKEREKRARDQRETKENDTRESTAESDAKAERDARRDREKDRERVDTKENEIEPDHMNGTMNGIDQQVGRKRLTCDTGSEGKDSGKR